MYWYLPYLWEGKCVIALLKHQSYIFSISLCQKRAILFWQIIKLCRNNKKYRTIKSFWHPLKLGRSSGKNLGDVYVLEYKKWFGIRLTDQRSACPVVSVFDLLGWMLFHNCSVFEFYLSSVIIALPHLNTSNCSAQTVNSVQASDIYKSDFLPHWMGYI